MGINNKKLAALRKRELQELSEQGKLKVTKFSNCHFRINDHMDYWPTTGSTYSIVNRRRKTVRWSIWEAADILADTTDCSAKRVTKRRKRDIDRKWAIVRRIVEVEALARQGLAKMDHQWRYSVLGSFKYHVRTGKLRPADEDKPLANIRRTLREFLPELPVISVPDSGKHLYAAFLATDHWKNWRNQVVMDRGGACVRCGTTKKLHLHHVKYNVKLTQPKSVEVLCQDCHSREHGI